jgi:hypothetical protein
LLFTVCFLHSRILFAQTIRKHIYSVELGGILSLNSKTPFWLRNNEFGAIPTLGNSVIFRQNLISKPDTSKKFFKTRYSIDMATFVGQEARIVIPEAFYQVQLGRSAFTFGRRKQIHGLVDSTLSSGSITWSGNAIPLPEIQFSISDYHYFFGKLFAFKGHLSHGWFGNQLSVKNYYLHQKSLYGRIGKANGKIKLYGGMLHHVQWGGTPKYDVPLDDPLYVDGHFARDWTAFKNVVLPIFNPGLDSTSGYSQYDYENRFGNHLGQIDLGAEWIIKKTKIFGYKQIIFETGQTFSSLTNIDDGLYGLSISSLRPESKFKKTVFEFLHTTNQGIYRSGLLRLIGFEGRHYGRNQNYYFNHGQYKEGWSYNGLSIGTPFMIPDSEIRQEKRTDTEQFFSNNNRIKAIYWGLQTKLNSIEVESRFSYSRNFGSSRVNLQTADQLSIGVKTNIPAPNLHGIISVCIGVEHGDLIKDNYGTFVSFKRVWK